ncbi:MAG: hypothetical protein LBM09_01800, partial [Candidatus Nomurabacteria bacterium]|nr:hypothetical protein [Candidatus Nomurabacteria bacterium]
NIKFLLCYPDTSLLDEYILKYKERGNNVFYIDRIKREFINEIPKLDKIDNIPKIKLSYGENLESVLIKNNVTLSPKH